MNKDTNLCKWIEIADKIEKYGKDSQLRIELEMELDKLEELSCDEVRFAISCYLLNKKKLALYLGAVFAVEQLIQKRTELLRAVDLLNLKKKYNISSLTETSETEASLFASMIEQNDDYLAVAIQEERECFAALADDEQAEMLIWKLSR